ncbi:uncharacterized protein LOC115225117 isoform X2 [Octopus sinensis]|uniref:Uncharacterized protein LOC115225117 isoform X2 n=1 Tax=Octopus sinensis TaxID=2607531 RepID=A0A7E6FTE9_9MOLL|nr:uncharacterized protein LOC115225117 isoform X2 [Octopus sinensis]
MGTNWKYHLLLFFLKVTFWVTYGKRWNLPFDSKSGIIHINITCKDNTVLAVKNLKWCRAYTENPTTIPQVVTNISSNVNVTNATDSNITQTTPVTVLSTTSSNISSTNIPNSHQSTYDVTSYTTSPLSQNTTEESLTSLPPSNPPDVCTYGCRDGYTDVCTIQESIVVNCSDTSYCNFTTYLNTSNSLYSNITNLELYGQCIYEEHRLEICEKNKLEGTIIFLHEPLKSLNNFTCSCTATSNDRLQIKVMNVVTNKTVNASKEEITNFLKLNDIPVTKTGLLNFTSNNMVNMTFHKEINEPYQIWLEISSEELHKVSVECTEIPKEPPEVISKKMMKYDAEFFTGT